MGGVRCLRHAGPKAAAAHRERQLAGLRTGRVTPEVFARAEARRARNRLLDRWKRNPSLPGATIDLGADESRFQDALAACGVQSGTDLPAVMDWLRWRFRRTMIDRLNADAWARSVGDGLRTRLAAAEAAMVWVKLGDQDRRTKTGRAILAALRTGGEARAAAVAAELAVDAVRGGRGPRLASGSGSVRLWQMAGASPSPKRRRADLPKVSVAAVRVRQGTLKGPKRPRWTPVNPDELEALAAVLQTAGSPVRALYCALARQEDQLHFLRDLRAYADAPCDAGALRRWMGWIRSDSCRA